jgi:hypothetical protein
LENRLQGKIIKEEVMKKMSMVSLVAAVLFCLTSVLPAFAADVEYGGMWRTRAFTIDGFSGDSENDSRDYSAVDSRARIWFNFEINKETNWFNQVEINYIWGDEDNGGGIGTDGTDYLRWKHSYLNLNHEIVDGVDTSFRVGLQPYALARGFLFDDDFAGLVATYTTPDGSMKFPLVWMKVFEGGTLSGSEENEEAQNILEEYDVDFVGLAPELKFMDDALAVKPFGFYLTSAQAEGAEALTGNADVDVWFAGLEVAYKTDETNIWALGVYEFGEAEIVTTNEELDVAAYLVAVGAEQRFGDLGIHGTAFYATGDDDSLDEDETTFFIPYGQSYAWSEIMGEGIFDAYGASNGACGTAISNIAAVGGGLSYQLSDKWKVRGDVWYAQLAEAPEDLDDDYLGTEVDLRVDYQVNDDVTLTAIGAYLFAGDATTWNYADGLEAEDATDPWEVGLQLTFRFSS